MPFSLIPFLLLIIPALEIGVFIMVGGQIGILATIGMILLTAVIGSILLRWQGFQVLTKFQAESAAGKVPGKELLHGAMILVAGVLLLTPGFVTDSIGFLLFVPGVRNVIWSFISSKIKFSNIGAGSAGMGFGNDPFNGGFGKSGFGQTKSDDIVDLDPDEFSDIPNADSPWGNESTNGKNAKTPKIEDK
ncbi:MAG: FxsA family protein [Nitratireductor sp.]